MNQATTAERARQQQWATRHLERGGPFFSFSLDGTPSDQFLPHWHFAATTLDLGQHRRKHHLTWTDAATGLEVRGQAIEYGDFPTVEWTLHLCNTGASPSPLVRDLHPLTMDLRRQPKGEFVLHHWSGDACTPDSYQPHHLELPPGAGHTFAPAGGRPCNQAFPYFNLEWNHRGLIAAIGWPGQWALHLRRDEGERLHLSAGQELTCFRLEPGEEVRTPLVVLQFWEGDQTRSQNLWRRWMLAHNLPRDAAGVLPPPLLASCSGGFFPGLKCNETDEKFFIDTLLNHGVPLDYWWMDAGWYPCGDNWPNTGTWEPDPERFPRGLRGVTDHAHNKGLKAIVWFEPARVAPGSWLDQQHPEWLLGTAGEQRLLNLGDPQARAWLTDHVSGLISSQGIDLYRQDFNIDPLSFWRAADSPERQGLTEIRHVEGYLAYWDALRQRHPGLLIDSCASGGRRNDLETLRRAVPLLRSDYQSFQGDPAYAPGNQGHTYGLSSWIPYYGQGVYYRDEHLEYNVRSHFCPAFGLGIDVRQPGIDWPRFTKLLAEWRAISASLLGDFYPLTPYSLDESVWMAWQFHRPEKNQGAVQAFRRTRSSDKKMRFRLQGLEPAAEYAVEDLDTHKTQQLRGAELMGPGLEVRISAKPGAALFSYRMVEKRN
ncbi:MAG: alpha-galactosidase [Candidatus Latescibacteria bacterium]|nr:alpha-galactosidase [Candidatus Latescibacterota bacterium]